MPSFVLLDQNTTFIKHDLGDKFLAFDSNLLLLKILLYKLFVCSFQLKQSSKRTPRNRVCCKFLIFVPSTFIVKGLCPGQNFSSTVLSTFRDNLLA